MDRLNKAQMEFMNGYVPATIHDIYNYAEGGGIHIDPSKKGTFKAQATRMNMGVQEAASHILANKDDYSSTMVKKANFAKNFAKQEGGVAQGDQGNAQMMQTIQRYAELLAQESGDDPNKVYQDVMQQLEQLKPDQQKEALKIIVNKVQGASQQPAMQMGGDPSQMQQAPQEQGGDAEQLMQQVQQMLEQGAQPQEVIAQLLQSQVEPQMVVEIFVQLGMPEDQVIQEVQTVMQQMGGGQEEENPQEQMQEQGMEEPMQEASQQGMEYGGIAKYPYGGMYADKKYYGDFLPQDAFNNAMTDINMLAMPAATMAATNIKPLKQGAGLLAAAGALAGSIQGYRGGINALFGNKNAPDTKAVSYNTTSKVTPYNNPMQSSPVVGPQRYEDLPSETFPYKKGGEMIKRADGSYSQRGMWDNIRANKGSGKKPSKEMLAQERKINSKEYGGGINNPGFKALPKYVQDKILSSMEYGGLPQAQFGIPGEFDFNDPYGLQQNRFGQTANYADTRGYKSNVPAQTMSLTDEQVLNQNGKYDGYAFPQNSPESYNKKINKKTINVSGQQMANNALLGLSIFNNSLGEDSNVMNARQANRIKEASGLRNPLNFSGVNTVNVQGGGNEYIPNRYTAIQDYGTTGNVIARNGGQMNFANGGQYKVSHDQLLQLLRDGAEIEFL